MIFLRNCRFYTKQSLIRLCSSKINCKMLLRNFRFYKTTLNKISTLKVQVYEKERILNKTISDKALSLENQLNDTDTKVESVRKAVIALHQGEFPGLLACGGIGWRRVVFLNMTDPNQVGSHTLKYSTYTVVKTWLFIVEQCTSFAHCKYMKTYKSTV